VTGTSFRLRSFRESSGKCADISGDFWGHCSMIVSAGTGKRIPRSTQFVNSTLNEVRSVEGMPVVNRRTFGFAVGTLVGSTLLSACALRASAASNEKPSVDLYLSILTGRMLNHKGWPAYVPAVLTAPANATVNVRIVNFDDGTAALPDNSPQAKVAGTIQGTATWQPLNMNDPNASGKMTLYQSIAPKDVAHTFTLPALNVNVPLPVSSVVSFSFETGKPGTYMWQCMAPCGSPPEGWGGAMHMNGYMMGSLHVV